MVVVVFEGRTDEISKRLVIVYCYYLSGVVVWRDRYCDLGICCYFFSGGFVCEGRCDLFCFVD